MKKTKLVHATIICLLALLCLVVGVGQISQVGAYVPNPKKIIVNGSAELSFAPDTAIVNVGVDTVNSNLETAQKENRETMEKLIDVLTSNGIEKSDIKTTRYHIFENRTVNGEKEFYKNQVSNHISFKTTNINGISDLITALTENGANSFGGISFVLSNNSDAYNQALSKAIENAEQKAKILSPNNNLSVMEILEEYSYATPCYLTNLNRTSLDDTFVLEGEVKISANVKVVFGMPKDNVNHAQSEKNTIPSTPIIPKEQPVKASETGAMENVANIPTTTNTSNTETNKNANTTLNENLAQNKNANNTSVAPITQKPAA